MSALPSIAPPGGRPTEADAAADLYARHSGRIFGYCLGLLRNREEAEDAVQTTFLNAYRGLRRGVRPEFEAAWLFKIAQNVCRTRQANASRRSRIETVRDLDAVEDAVAAPERDAGQAAVLAEALQELPERCRTVILLREWQGLSYREIAAATGDSEAAVEMLAFRARRALAERLERSDVRSGALSLSSLVSLLKSLFGGAAVKAVATGLAATAAAIAVAATPGDEGRSSVPTRGPSTRAVVPAAPSVVPRRAVANPGRSRRSAPALPANGGASTDTPPPAHAPSTVSPGHPQAPPSVPSSTATSPAAGPPAPAVSPPSEPAPSVGVPSVTAPSVTVPDTSVSTPAVSTPTVTAPLPANPPELPLSPPGIPVP